MSFDSFIGTGLVGHVLKTLHYHVVEKSMQIYRETVMGEEMVKG